MYSYPQQVPAFISRGATHHTDVRDLYQRRRELLSMNFASKSVIHENPLGSFTRRKAGTGDTLFYFPSEGRHTEVFPDARKIQQLRPGLNPQTRVPVASMLTTRPPKPSCFTVSTNVDNQSNTFVPQNSHAVCEVSLHHHKVQCGHTTSQGPCFSKKEILAIMLHSPDTINKVIYRRRDNVEKFTFFARNE